MKKLRNEKPELSKKSPFYITKYRYYELKNFCLQYPDWKKALEQVDGWESSSHEVSGIIRGSLPESSTERQAMIRAYMALGKAYQEYRREVAEHIGAEHEKEIYKDARSVLKEPTSDMVEDKLLCYEPISKRYFHATEAALLEAFYSLNRDFALNGYASMNDLYNYLGLDYIPEGDLKVWRADYLAADWEYFWIDFSYLKQKTDDGLEVCYVEAYQEPIDDYLNYDPSKDTPF